MARNENRKKDTREKIQLGGLIAKAGLRYEKRALLLGLLIETKRTLTGNTAERARLLAIGEEAFRDEAKEADVPAGARSGNDGDDVDADGDRAMDREPGNKS